MNDDHRHLESLIESQLDREDADKLSGRASREEVDERVRAEFAMQDLINQSLRRQFHPPPPPAPPLAPEAEHATEAVCSSGHGQPEILRILSKLSSHKRWLAAAAVLLVVVGAWQVWTRLNPGPPPTLHALYQHAQDNESLVWLTRDARQLPGLSEYMVGVSLQLDALPSGLAVIGMVEIPRMGDSFGLLAKSDDGELVLLLVCPGDVQSLVAALPEQALHSHQRRLGRVMLYEVSPHPHALLLHAIEVLRDCGTP